MSSVVQMPCKSGWPHGVRGGGQLGSRACRSLRFRRSRRLCSCRAGAGESHGNCRRNQSARRSVEHWVPLRCSRARMLAACTRVWPRLGEWSRARPACYDPPPMKVAVGVAFAALATASPSFAQAQRADVHLNPVVAKLAAGDTVYGLINSGDLSLANARETARAPVDFTYADMEHNPLDFPGLATFLLGMTDKAALQAKGNLQPNVALFARFPPEADESDWVVKQALDIGLMGVVFNGVDTPEQALTAVRTMRYPPLRGAPRPEPRGIRGYGDGGRRLCLGRQRGRIRAARRCLAAESRRRPARHRHDRVRGRLEERRRDRGRARSRGTVSRRRLGSVALARCAAHVARARDGVPADLGCMSSVPTFRAVSRRATARMSRAVFAKAGASSARRCRRSPPDARCSASSADSRIDDSRSGLKRSGVSARPTTLAPCRA